MESRGKEYLAMVCTLYGAAVFALLPLYMKEGYWQLGDAKYVFFRDVSLLCLAVCLLAGGVCCLTGLWKRISGGSVKCGKKFKGSKVRNLRVSEFRMEERRRRSSEFHAIVCGRCAGMSGSVKQMWSVTDLFVVMYVLANVLSFLGSRYRGTAWTGYEQWYMGLLSQLLFAAGYFLFSRFMENDRPVCLLACGALLAVSVTGILNRLKFDPFGWFRGLDSMDWDFNHLLSTVGNINWLCGYLSVSVAIAVSVYMRAQSGKAQLLAFPAALSGLFLLLIQGSDAGLGVLAAGLTLMGIRAFESASCLRKALRLILGMIALFPLMTLGIRKRMSWYSFPFEDKSRALMAWWGWPAVALILLLVYLLTFKVDFKAMRRLALRGSLAVGGIFVIGGLVWVCAHFSVDYTWGSGRGGLWAMALRAFREGDVTQKLLGAGPDCYGHYIYDKIPVALYFNQQGRWADAVFTNAHNEWLNQLVNTGLLGLTSYAGIFLSALARYGKRCAGDAFFDMGVMALCMYGINSLVSFQQVMNAPLLFLTLGMCENHLRRTAGVCTEGRACGEAQRGDRPAETAGGT